MHIYKMSEWEIADKWYCNDVTELGKNSGLWWYPVRLLGISPADFVLMLKNEYHADNISYAEDRDVLIYSWNKENYSYMHKFVLMINRTARNKQFFV